MSDIKEDVIKKKRRRKKKTTSTSSPSTSPKGENISSTQISNDAVAVLKTQQKNSEIASQGKLGIDDISAYISRMKDKSSIMPGSAQENLLYTSSSGIDLLGLPGLYALIPHIKGDHKLVYFRGQQPDHLRDDDKNRVKGGEYVKQGNKIYDVCVDFKRDPELLSSQGEHLGVWIIDEAEDLQKQLQSIKQSDGGGRNFGDPIFIPLSDDPIISTPSPIDNSGTDTTDNATGTDAQTVAIETDSLPIIEEPKITEEINIPDVAVEDVDVAVEDVDVGDENLAGLTLDESIQDDITDENINPVYVPESIGAAIDNDITVGSDDTQELVSQTTELEGGIADTDEQSSDNTAIDNDAFRSNETNNESSTGIPEENIGSSVEDAGGVIPQDSITNDDISLQNSGNLAQENNIIEDTQNIGEITIPLPEVDTSPSLQGDESNTEIQNNTTDPQGTIEDTPILDDKTIADQDVATIDISALTLDPPTPISDQNSIIDTFKDGVDAVFHHDPHGETKQENMLEQAAPIKEIVQTEHTIANVLQSPQDLSSESVKTLGGYASNPSKQGKGNESSLKTKKILITIIEFLIPIFLIIVAYGLYKIMFSATEIDAPNDMPTPKVDEGVFVGTGNTLPGGDNAEDTNDDAVPSLEKKQEENIQTGAVDTTNPVDQDVGSNYTMDELQSLLRQYIKETEIMLEQPLYADNHEAKKLLMVVQQKSSFIMKKVQSEEDSVTIDEISQGVQRIEVYLKRAKEMVYGN